MPIEELAVAEETGSDEMRALLRDVTSLPLASWPDLLRDVRLPRVAEHLRFSRERYTRTLLASTPEAEMLLLGWLPGQCSAIHDHGRSRGVAMGLAGEGVEETFELRGGRPIRVAAREFGVGSALDETPGGIHRVVNPGPGLMATLHVYAPRLEEFRTYEP